MAVVTEQDRERARRITQQLYESEHPYFCDQNIELLAQSYAEVREEAEKQMRANTMVACPDCGTRFLCRHADAIAAAQRIADFCGDQSTSEVDAGRRAGMEEAARIADRDAATPCYSAACCQGCSHSYAEGLAKAIRAAMKEGGKG